MPAEGELPHLMARLPKWRHEQAMRFKYYLGQRNCTLSYLLLQKGLANLWGNSQSLHHTPQDSLTSTEAFAYGEHGKPYLPSHPHTHFNMSHCNNAIACVVDTTPVGIDVEDLGRYSESVARYSMNDAEMQQILAAPDSDLAFTRLWTRKEAVLKLRGIGLTDDLKNVLQPENLQGIRLETKDYPEFILSVAWQQVSHTHHTHHTETGSHHHSHSHHSHSQYKIHWSDIPMPHFRMPKMPHIHWHTIRHKVKKWRQNTIDIIYSIIVPPRLKLWSKSRKLSGAEYQDYRVERKYRNYHSKFIELIWMVYDANDKEICGTEMRCSPGSAFTVIRRIESGKLRDLISENRQNATGVDNIVELSFRE